MEMIATDSAAGRYSRKGTGKADAMREKGLCPHDGSACLLARRCELGREDACIKLLTNAVQRCSLCRRRAPCAFACFRKDAVKKGAVYGGH